MTEITKDFIKFIAEVIILLIIFSVIFGEEGIAQNTYNYMIFAEPMLLQNYIYTAVEIASEMPGNFESEIRTSGEPYIIKIYYTDVPYIEVLPPEEKYLKTEFAKIEPTALLTNCIVHKNTIKLKEGLVQNIEIKKIQKENTCEIFICVGGVC